jgi:hypothetical protein
LAAPATLPLAKVEKLESGRNCAGTIATTPRLSRTAVEGAGGAVVTQPFARKSRANVRRGNE